MQPLPELADVKGLRRVPRQARSREKVARMLAAADRLLAEEGPEALTTTRVAAAAGISVGALYQYLPDRQAIVEAVADLYMSRLEALMDSFVAAAPTARWDDPVTVLIDAFVALYREQAGFRALWFSKDLSDNTREADRRHKRLMAARLHKILVILDRLPDTDEAAQACYALFLAGDAVLQEAFRIDPEGDPMLLRHLDGLLRSYVTDLATRN